jgi:hypothetical protein
MAVLLFPTTSNHRWNAALKLKEHARTATNADDETIVTISERDYGDPGCGGGRTIVLIMHPRRPTEAFGIDKPIEQITQTDLSDALAPLAARTGLSEASVETEMTIAPARASALVEPH